MVEEILRPPHRMDYVQQRALFRNALLRLQTHADRSHQRLKHSQRLLGRRLDASVVDDKHVASRPENQDDMSSSPRPIPVLDEREKVARQRLLEWEAADLAQVIPDEMGTPRRRFAVSLYETIAMSESLGMSEERLVYHLRAALERYRLGE